MGTLPVVFYEEAWKDSENESATKFLSQAEITYNTNKKKHNRAEKTKQHSNAEEVRSSVASYPF